MEEKIKELELKITNLERKFFQLPQALERSMELTNELAEKSAENFIAIQKALENVNKYNK